MKFANDVSYARDARVKEDQRDQLNNNHNSSRETEQMKMKSDTQGKSHLSPNPIIKTLKQGHAEKRPSLRANGGVATTDSHSNTRSMKIRKHSQRRKSSRKSSANRLSELQLINFKPFEIFRQLKSISMCLGRLIPMAGLANSRRMEC